MCRWKWGFAIGLQVRLRRQDTAPVLCFAYTSDVDKKLSFLNSRRTTDEPDSIQGLSRDLDAVKYDVGELKDLLNGAKGDTAQVKRIVLACERDMEDFTAAMDAVNVDLDEMRARVDSTHSIITSRQRVEATVTAEISTMRLDMGDMQEALKAHDAWMEDVSQSLQEVHERCEYLNMEISGVNQNFQAKLDAKTDIASWNDMNDDIDASIRTVRDMASSLRLEVDSRRRRVDEDLLRMRSEVSSLDEKINSKTVDILRESSENNNALSRRLDERQEHCNSLEAMIVQHRQTSQEMQGKIDVQKEEMESRISSVHSAMAKQGEDLQRSTSERMESLEQQQNKGSKDSQKHLNAMDLRLAALQGATGECKRDIGKMRDEVNSLTVKSAAHDVDVAKNSDDIRKLERQRVEDDQRHKQEFDGIYDELDQMLGWGGWDGEVAKLPHRMLTEVSLSFEEIDHLQTTLAVIQSRRYINNVKRPWLDEDGNPMWGEWRTWAAKVVFSQAFETCMGALVGAEADQDAQCYPEWADKYAQCPNRSEESIVRAYVERNRFCCNPWNVTDLMIVILGWASIALSTLNLSLLRLSRLVRVLRAARVFISVPEFYLLVSGLFSSFKAIVFGSMILVSVIGFWAVVAVEAFHPVVSSLSFAGCQRCDMSFRSVTSAGVTLFQQIVAGQKFFIVSKTWKEAKQPNLK
ncbi:unnamed protein product [Cladocopium goreaui]|uniref:Sodium channel protein type 11 subunit alpha n=1 Tax=Cladocopium goreaui TaxID=2562237 RepID=A0A9P1M570_9DINO|nr:unnamed protein product [Cladocopium goreaui]